MVSSIYGIVTFLSVTPSISCPCGKPTLGNKDGCCLNLGTSRFRHLCPLGGITPGGHIRVTTSAYHPRHLLYKVDYFGTVADFHEKCGEQGWPDLPWADFLPATAVRALQQIIQWGILAEYFDNPSLNFPFQLPSLEEKVVDAELTSFGEDAMHDVNIPNRLMHDLIGNYFKPSAGVTAANITCVSSSAEKSNRRHGSHALPPSYLLSTLPSDSKYLKTSIRPYKAFAVKIHFRATINP